MGLRGGRKRGEMQASGSAPVLLLVDDETRILSALRRTLRREGYEILTAESVAEALRILGSRQVDLVLTDQTMPNMTGERLAKELMAIRPNVPIILCTGFSEMVSEEKAKTAGIREFIMKPFLIRELATTIRKSLE